MCERPPQPEAVKFVPELGLWPPGLCLPETPLQVAEQRPWEPLTLQALHVLVTVVLVVTVLIVPVTVHQQDGSVPTGPPDPLPLPMAKQSW